MKGIDEFKKSYVKLLLDKNERADKRGFKDYRPISIETGVIDTAEGSAWVKLGNTQVLAAVKFDVVEPFPDTPTSGVLSVNAEMLPMASPNFEPGPPDERTIELARVVDRAIRSAEIVDVESLFIEEGKVYGVFVDIYLLDYDGNYLDASSLAAMAALKSAKIPVFEDGKLNRDKTKPFEVKGDVVEVTFVKIGDKILVDPALDEEKARDARITIGVMGDRICAIQKTGTGSITEEELSTMIDIAIEKGRELVALLPKQ